MRLADKRILVAGGAGFIGTHLVESLLPENDVVVADDLSNGRRESIPDGAAFVEADLVDRDAVSGVLDESTDLVFHLAAASKSVNTANPRDQFEANTAITHNLLQEMRKEDISSIVYTSSSTVYGEAPRPTPEDFAPLEPISVYGAAKLAEEGLLTTYAHSFDISATIFRFANIVGPGLEGAVIPDFIEKLRAGPQRLTILGNGRQEKSYMHVEECVGAMRHVVERVEDPVTIFNLGTRTTTSVDRVADIVADELGVDPEYQYTGGDRGWTGDVPKMRLSIEKVAAIGWTPDLSSDEAVRRASRELIDEADSA